MPSPISVPDAFDVVCIGGGGGGLAAAVTAAESGASVLVLEKRRVMGGNSSAASGVFAAESPTHERLNIVAPREALYRSAVEYSHWRVNAALVRSFVDRSADTIEWLEGLGVEFEWITPLFEGQNPPTWHVPRGGGTTIVDTVVERSQALGAVILLEAAAQDVRRTADGRLEVAVVRSGDETIVSAGAVVIATGGYAGNSEMLRAYCPGYDPEAWFCTGLRHDGDGIRMAFALGAAAEGLGLCEFHGPSVQGPMFLSLALREPSALIVNALGRRYFDEGIVDNAFEAANALRRQPTQTAFAILDRSLRDHVLRKAANKARGPLYEDQMHDPDHFRKLLDGLGGNRGRVVDSLEDAAAWIGCDHTELAETAARYNRACASGFDEAFAKDRRHLRAIATPPFYVIRGTVGVFNTIGGIRVNEYLEVVDDADQSLPGVFAAGVDVGGWQGDTYNFHLAGGSLGFALTSGRLAGARAANHAKGAEQQMAVHPTAPGG